MHQVYDEIQKKMSDELSNDTPQQAARRAFEALIAGEDAAIDLAQAALLIANEEYPHLNVTYYLARLDALALRVRELAGVFESDTLPQLPREEVLEAINRVLFEQEHFHGNLDDYYDPRNSFLNDVLERQTGIPITLSLLYMEVGRRVGVQLEGIGLPFHFVVRCRLPDSMIYIDPYESGRFLSEQECRERVLRLLKGRASFNPRWLEPVTHRQFLVRLLNNLKHIYVQKEDFERALSICDRILLLTPAAAPERRDRGIIHLRLKHYSRALRDLNAYVKLAPEDEDIDEVIQQIKTIRQIMAMMN